MHQRRIRASEIGQYVFCPRAWWLSRVDGVVPSIQAPLRRGTRMHNRHGRQVFGAAFLNVAGWIILALAVIILVVILF